MGRFAAPRPFLARLRRASAARAGALAVPAVTAAAGLAAGPAWAQGPLPLGPEVQVSTYTSSSQNAPAVARDDVGRYVVVWRSNFQDGDGVGVYARRYGPDGAPLGAEFLVTTTTTGSQSNPAVAMDGDGDFAIVWSGVGNGDAYGVFGQRYAAEGTPVGGEFRVNTTTANLQAAPSAAMDGDGDLVVAWQSTGQDGSGSGVYAQRFDADGGPVGGEFRVNTYTAGTQRLPSVAAADDAAGAFVVVWESFGQDGDRNGIYAQRYDGAGAPDGSEFLVNTTTTDSQYNPAVAVDADGDAIVVWTSTGQDGDLSGVYAQRFSASGAPVGAEFRANTTTTSQQREPAVAMGAGGAFVVVWESNWQDGSSTGVYGQRYRADGAPLGGEFQVNTYTTSEQASPSVAMDGDGDVVVAWASYGQDGDNYGVFAQRFQGPNRPVATAPVGPGAETPVNTTTTSSQANPSVAANADGNAVVAWVSNLQDGNGAGIYTQRYAPDGSPVGGETLVNATTTGFQVNPDVAMDADGDYVVVWQGSGPDGYYGFDVFAQRYAAGGTPVGGEIQVNTYTTSEQASPSVAMDADGDFVVAWQSYAQDGSYFGVFAQRYAADGSPVDGEFQVNTTPTSRQFNPSAAMDADGDFIVAWESYVPGGNDIFVQRYAADGSPVGGETLVNTFTEGEQTEPAVAMDPGGDFVVAWSSYGGEGGGDYQDYGVFAQRYAADGSPVDGEILVNTFTTGTQRLPSVAMDGDGDFVVAWNSYGQYDGEYYDVYTRRYTADGSPVGEELRVNTHLPNQQIRPDVAMGAGNEALVAWGSRGGQDGDAEGIYARRFPVPVAAGLTAELRGAEGWRMLAAPTPTATVGGLLGPVWTQGFPGADYAGGGANVYRYDESVAGDRAVGYVAPASAGEVMTSGRGYFAYVYEDDDFNTPPIDGGFPKTLAVTGDAPAGPVALPVTYTDTAAPEQEDGWNLVGNPYRQSIDWDLAARTDVASSAYVYDPALPGYRVWNGAVGNLARGVVTALQGFWVKAMDTDASGDVTPSATVPEEAQVPEQGAFYGRTGTEEEAPAAGVLALTLTREDGGYGRTAQTFVSFEAGAQSGLDAADAYALAPAAADYTALFTRAADGTALAIQSLPETAGSYTLPLEVAAVEGGSPAGGTFTLAWEAPALPAGWRARLLDAATGASVDLTTAGTYGFTLDVPERRGTAPAATAALAPPAPRVLGATGDGLVSGRFSLVLDAATTGAAGETAAALALTVAPNPLTGAGVVRYVLPEAAGVRVAVYDVLGREVAVLADAEQGAGRYDVALDASALAPGAYLVRLTAGDAALVRRVTVTR